MKLVEFLELVKKIESLHSSIVVDLKDSCVMPDACQKWLRRQIDSKIPYQEKHVLQQASILGNMERFRILHSPKEKLIGLAHKEGMEEDNSAWNDDVPAVVEFGAGRGYLTQMLADSYGIHRIFLVERKSYKLKADRSLRQNESISLKRLRIDIEDLDLHAVESLNGHPFLAIGKHLCGSATDLAIRCCCPGQNNLNKKTLLSSCYLQGIAIATCCHHLCQWKHYLNASYFLDWGMTREEFHAITWFSSWAVDGDHGSNPSILADSSMEPNSSEVNESGPQSVEEAIRNMKHAERAALGFKCKDVIDMGRIIWLREQGFIAELVKYVPSRISPENHLLLAKLKLPFIVRE
ncbi:tRNA guanosine-2'-O-methyltransferase TRM13 [Apostasia shenzhenica]|uniref:tRNA:m(4)X modification enzyme TRM13 n=1 Tax=Apostasia shenzhenica TaxID=1088818 RepID=A0A2I0AAW7_9ASPA|nr:tRNA guanosine-2'-O-methyltransferase TRM13 [Apostasia shenzhenica]